MIAHALDERGRATFAGIYSGATTALLDSDGGDILVLSSASIMRGLLEADLLDVLHLQVVPVVLGHGLRFWPEGAARTDWVLDGATVLPSGAVHQAHRRDR